jgi:hypothetical protein
MDPKRLGGSKNRRDIVPPIDRLRGNDQSLDPSIEKLKASGDSTGKDRLRLLMDVRRNVVEKVFKSRVLHSKEALESPPGYAAAPNLARSEKS